MPEAELKKHSHTHRAWPQAQIVKILPWAIAAAMALLLLATHHQGPSLASGLFEANIAGSEILRAENLCWKVEQAAATQCQEEWEDAQIGAAAVKDLRDIHMNNLTRCEHIGRVVHDVCLQNNYN